MSTLFSTSGPAATRFVRVVLERGIEGMSGDEGLTYSVPEESVPALGERVTVPLGRGGTTKPVGGIVVRVGGKELLEGFDAQRVKPILACAGAALSPGLMELARWMSQYYVCPLGMVFQTVMPSAVKHDVGGHEVVRLALDGARMSEVVAGMPTRSVRALIAQLQTLDASVFPAEPRRLADALAQPTLRGVGTLIRLGVLREERHRAVAARGSGDELLSSAAKHTGELGPTPTPGQQRVIDGIGASLDRFGVHLIRGVTGSGKTEVYLRLMQRVLHERPGEGCIVLVPEIALTPQTAERFSTRFKAQGVAVLHSGLSQSRRHSAWADVAAGRLRVVVGARSAIFAPLPKIGLIVVDEEHESSYKQDQLPRYHARDVAIKRAQLEGCPVVLGSATPSLESYSNAIVHPPRATLWELKERAGGGRMPKVEIVDLSREDWTRAPRGAGEKPAMRFIGARLAHELTRTLREGGQALLLLNRRGFANYIACGSFGCEYVLRCDECDAGMVLHKDRRVPRGGVVKCHHCLAEQTIPRLCPLCGKGIVPKGQGTQRIEEELESRFGVAALGEGALVCGSTMLRVDSDTMRSSKDYFDALARFARGEIRVLLGTQMIAKGLDFPNVRLVGVINADTALSMPDFRAGERTFQLVCQVAGRAGRAAHEGLVIVQTMCPDAPAIRLAASHDYVEFASRELAVRARAGLPPSVRMARIVCRDADAGKASARAQELAKWMREAAAALAGEVAQVRIDGPMEAPIARIAGQWRFVIELIGSRAGAVQRVLGSARGAGMLKSDAQTAVDVDPVSLL